MVDWIEPIQFFHSIIAVTRYKHVANITSQIQAIVNSDLFTSFLLGSPWHMLCVFSSSLRSISSSAFFCVPEYINDAYPRITYVLRWLTLIFYQLSRFVDCTPRKRKCFDCTVIGYWIGRPSAQYASVLRLPALAEFAPWLALRVTSIGLLSIVFNSKATTYFEWLVSIEWQ